MTRSSVWPSARGDTVPLMMLATLGLATDTFASAVTSRVAPSANVPCTRISWRALAEVNLMSGGKVSSLESFAVPPSGEQALKQRQSRSKPTRVASAADLGMHCSGNPDRAVPEDLFSAGSAVAQIS